MFLLQDLRDRLSEYNADLRVSEDRVVLLGAAAVECSVAPPTDDQHTLQTKIKVS